MKKGKPYLEVLSERLWIENLAKPRDYKGYS
jgi:hypothetical protein